MVSQSRSAASKITRSNSGSTSTIFTSFLKMTLFLFIGYQVGKMHTLSQCNLSKGGEDGGDSYEKITTESKYDGKTDSNQMTLSNPNVTERIAYFKNTAFRFKPQTDKIGGVMKSFHRYHNMYGQFLFPMAASKPNLKFLEIGLGCNMNYGPGASVRLWKTFFPQADLWEADYDAECVEKSKNDGKLEGINVLVGDQGNYTILDTWIEQSGGKFDVIIDDGGHTNCQISNTLDKLWPQLNPGGLYFIEDLQCTRLQIFMDCEDVIMGDKMRDWQQALIYEPVRSRVAAPLTIKYEPPEDLIFIHCQAEACVLGKRHSAINDPVSPEEVEMKLNWKQES